MNIEFQNIFPNVNQDIAVNQDVTVHYDNLDSQTNFIIHLKVKKSQLAYSILFWGCVSMKLIKRKYILSQIIYYFSMQFYSSNLHKNSNYCLVIAMLY